MNITIILKISSFDHNWEHFILNLFILKQEETFSRAHLLFLFIWTLLTIANQQNQFVQGSYQIERNCFFFWIFEEKT